MKFHKLYKFITEAKGVRHGNALYGAQQAEKPADLPSSSAHVRSTSPEVASKVSRWEFNPEMVTGGGKANEGFLLESMLFKSMVNSFALLLNDKNFAIRFKEISEDFGKKRQSISEKDERLLNTLEFERNKKITALQGVRNKIREFRGIIRDYEMSPSEKINLEDEMNRLKGYIDGVENRHKKDPLWKEVIKKLERKKDLKKAISEYKTRLHFTRSQEKIKKINKAIQGLEEKISTIDINLEDPKYSKFADMCKNFKKTTDRYERIVEKLRNSKLSKSSIESVKSVIFDQREEFGKLEKKFQELDEQYNELTERISQTNKFNEDLNDLSVQRTINLVTSTAKDLISTYAQRLKEFSEENLETLDWAKIITTKMDKVKRLEALSSEDPTVNPIIGYLERFERSYRDKEYKIDREFNPNINISAVRYYEMLPFAILTRLYRTIGHVKIELNDDYDDTLHENFLVLDAYLGLLKHANGATKVSELFQKATREREEGENVSAFNTYWPKIDQILREYVPNYELLNAFQLWTAPQHKTMLRWMITQTGLPEKDKPRYYLKLFSAWPQSVRKGKVNPFGELQSMMNVDYKRVMCKKLSEQFDKTFYKLISNVKYHEDDLKLDIMEICSYYNK